MWGVNEVALIFKSMSIYQKIQNLFAQKQKIEKEIMDIQKSCKHINEIVTSVKENEAGSNSVIRCICKDCNKVLRYPTDIEIFKYLSE